MEGPHRQRCYLAERSSKQYCAQGVDIGVVAVVGVIDMSCTVGAYIESTNITEACTGILKYAHSTNSCTWSVNGTLTSVTTLSASDLTANVIGFMKLYAVKGQRQHVC